MLSLFHFILIFDYLNVKNCDSLNILFLFFYGCRKFGNTAYRYYSFSWRCAFVLYRNTVNLFSHSNISKDFHQNSNNSSYFLFSVASISNFQFQITNERFWFDTHLRWTVLVGYICIIWMNDFNVLNLMSFYCHMFTMYYIYKYVNQCDLWRGRRPMTSQSPPLVAPHFIRAHQYINFEEKKYIKL
jgi:hypothetical protein